MYKQFAFEADVNESLNDIPLAVRRKLDLAALRISLQGWQHLSREARETLCQLPVETANELATYRKVMGEVCNAAGIAVRSVEDVLTAVRPWNAMPLPTAVLDYVCGLGGRIDSKLWRSFDEETRYAFWRLTFPKRCHEQMRSLLVELGLGSERLTSRYLDEFET
jgi:hypothetical protein